MDGEAMLRQMGFENITVAFSLRDAEQAVARQSFEVALLDINLGRGQTSLALAEKLLLTGTRVLFVSGYNASEGIVAHLQAKVIQKPIDEASLKSSIYELLQGESSSHRSGFAA